MFAWRKTALLTLAIAFGSLVAAAQVRLSALGGRGALIAGSAGALGDDNKATAFELSLARRTTPDVPWARALGRPYLGLSAGYTDHGAAEFGGAGYVLAFFEPQFARRYGASPRLWASLRLGAGAAYTTRPFDAETNPGNVMHGSHLNFALAGRLAVAARIAPRTSLSVGGYLLHLSNGALRKPNFGSNAVLLSVGVTHELDPAPGLQSSAATPHRAHAPANTTARRLHGYAEVRIGFAEMTLPTGDVGERDEVYAATMGVDYDLSEVYALTLSGGYLLHHGIGRRLDYAHSNGWHREHDRYDRAILGVGAAVRLGRFEIRPELLIAVYNPYPHPQELISQRYSLRHALGRRAYVTAGLNCYAAKADFASGGLGLKF